MSLLTDWVIRKIRSQKEYFLINNLIIPKKYGNVSKSIRKKYTFFNRIRAYEAFLYRHIYFLYRRIVY